MVVAHALWRRWIFDTGVSSGDEDVSRQVDAAIRLAAPAAGGAYLPGAATANPLTRSSDGPPASPGLQVSPAERSRCQARRAHGAQSFLGTVHHAPDSIL